MTTAHHTSRHHIVQTMEELAALCRGMLAASEVAIDLETQSLKSGPGQIVGIAAAYDLEDSWYIPIGHDSGDQLPYESVLSCMKQVIDRTTSTIVMHNAKFDTRFFRDDGVVIPPERVHDTMLEVSCSGTEFRRFGLKDLALWAYAHIMVEFDELFPKNTKKKDKRIAAVPIDLAGHYACEDAEYTLRLHRDYCSAWTRSPHVTRLEHRLWPVVQRIEDTGAPLDVEYALAMSEWLAWEADKVKEAIYAQFKALLGEEVRPNLGSPDQLAAILFDRIGLPVRLRSEKTNKPSTSETALFKLADGYPVVQLILQWRSINLQSKYVKEQLVANCDADGRVHTQYNQVGTVTGRFSSNSPNLQNVGKHSLWKINGIEGRYEVETSLREAFVASPGHYLIELDFAAIEFLLMGAIAGESDIVNTYVSGGDNHRLTASRVLKKPPEEVTSDEREKAKTINYLVIYGGSAAGLAQRTSLTEEDAKLYLGGFFETYRQVAATMNRLTQAAHRPPHTLHTVPMRRLLRIVGIDSEDKKLVRRAERQAVNAVIQGTAADIHKLGLLLTTAMMDARFPGSRLILQTHDSQTWEVPEQYSPDEVIPLLKDAMSPQLTGLPRVRVDAQLAISWGARVNWKPGSPPDWNQLRAEHAERLERMRRRDVVPIQKPVEPEPSPVPVLLDTYTYTIEVQNLDAETMSRFVSVLGAFSGRNQVAVKRGKTWNLSDYSTSLTPQEIQETATAIWPEAQVLVEKEDSLPVSALAPVLLGGIQLTNGGE